MVTDVDPDSDAADRGIQPGDIITAVNSTEVNGTEDVAKAMTEAVKAGRKAVLMQITRDDNTASSRCPSPRADAGSGTGVRFGGGRFDFSSAAVSNTPEPPHGKAWSRAR